MKISSETLNILKSYTSINPSIWVQPGTVVRTISPQKTIVATAEVDDVFDSNFGIYDLNQFLSVTTLFEDPDFVFDDKSVLIKNKSSSVEYFYTDKEMITIPPDKVIEFKLPVDIIKSTMQAANVLQLPEWSVLGQDGNIKIIVSDTKNSTGNVYNAVVGKTDENFNIIFKVENLKFMYNDYNVSISSKGISHFMTNDGKIQYWIATESR